MSGDGTGSLDEASAVSSLESLGLSNYEARVLVALQRLGVATAREVHEVTGVPRSQVYGAADDLVDRGLAERQQSTPKRFRAVGLEAARERLAAGIERELDCAFEFLESVQRDPAGAGTREDVWSVRGAESVSERVLQLVGAADERVVYAAAEPAFAGDDVVAALTAAAESGVAVTVVSADAAVREQFDPGLAVEPAPAIDEAQFTGRTLLVDDDAVLVSVRTDVDEVAIWSAETALADVLVRTVSAGMSVFLR
jgi:sugar-specific transcriptional regulator TrmB